MNPMFDEIVIPAQPGWRAVRSCFEFGQEPFILYDVPIVAWRICRQTAKPITPEHDAFERWVDGKDDFGDGSWMMVSPNGRVLDWHSDHDSLEGVMAEEDGQWQKERAEAREAMNAKIQPSKSTTP